MSISPPSFGGGVYRATAGAYGNSFPVGVGEYTPDSADAPSVGSLKEYLRIHGESQDAELTAYMMSAIRLAGELYGVYYSRGVVRFQYDLPAAADLYFLAAPMTDADVAGITGEWLEDGAEAHVSSVAAVGGGARVSARMANSALVLTRRRYVLPSLILRGGAGFALQNAPADLEMAIVAVAAAFYARRGESSQIGSKGRVSQITSLIPGNAGVVLKSYSPAAFPARL